MQDASLTLPLMPAGVKLLWLSVLIINPCVQTMGFRTRVVAAVVTVSASPVAAAD
jgi:hypothetical protein